jgi:hypothetical protein
VTRDMKRSVDRGETILGIEPSGGIAKTTKSSLAALLGPRYLSTEIGKDDPWRDSGTLE